MDAATSNPLFQAVDKMLSRAEARMPDPLHPIHAVRAGNLIPTQIDNTADLVLMLDDYCESVRKDDEDAGLWVRILATVERAQNQRDLLLEALQAFMAVDKSFGTTCDRHLDEMAKGNKLAAAVKLARAAIAEAQS